MVLKKIFECRDCGAVLKGEFSKCNVCESTNLNLIGNDYGELTEEKVQELSLRAYEQIISFLGEWVDIPEDYKKIIAIWICGTYLHKKFSTFPYLFFNAMRGSGKTRLLKIISWLQYNGNGDILNNPSEPVLFRTAKERGLIFDEFESEKSKDKQTMREYLNSCYKKGGKVFRMEKQRNNNKEEMVAVGHDLFTPVAMANINGIEDVLQDRCVTLIMEKSNNPALVKKIEDFDTNQTLKSLKTQLNELLCRVCSVEWLVECIKGWNMYVSSKYTLLHTIHMNTSTLHIQLTEKQLEMYNKIDQTGIFGRNLELYFPLLLTAKLINNSVFDEILEIVLKLNSTKKEDEFTESKDISLIEFVSLADRHRFEYKFIHELAEEFKEFVGPHGLNEDNWINSNWVGLALKRLKLVGDRKRVAKGILVLLAVDKAKEKIKMFKRDDSPISMTPEVGR